MIGAFMMTFIKAYWKPLAGAVVAVAVVVIAVLAWNIHGDSRYSAGQAAADQTWQLKWSARDTADRTAQLARETAERAEEQRRQRAADAERKRADEELAKVQADADAAQRAGDGLRKQLTTLQRQLAGSETGRLSAIAATGAAKTQVASLLAELLGEADAMAGEFAKEADERYVAGSTCERTYDEVTGKSHAEN